ncbi:4Fe-4S binding protein [candidate division KSB1 bacterium]|nr:4Fe-4S binding protein [candidate division KSB1 bacterium]
MPVISTIEEKCKRCYSCIRECPAKAIKVENGQAKVIESRCLGCGHCVIVCSQGAKAVLDGTDHVLAMLAEHETIAMLAPSFAAAFMDNRPEQVIGAVRACGFARVVEVAFGADLINKAYFRLVNDKDDGDETVKKPIIASSCPALANYIEKYMPELLPNLAPIVSPMVAMGRVVHKYYGKEVKIVFIGPCSAKKVEFVDDEVKDAVDEVLTFTELEAILLRKNVDIHTVEASTFDPPRAYLGRVYPLSGGLLRSAGLPADVMNSDMVVTEGKARVLNLVESLKNEQVDAKMIDILFCEGCISGPFMNHDINYFTRKQKVVRYTDEGRLTSDYPSWRKAIEECADVNVYRRFHSERVTLNEPSQADIRAILARIDKHDVSDELNCGACGYPTCRDYARAVYQNLAENDMCLPYLIDKKERMQRQLQDSLDALAETQQQLIQHEKLASIGQLAAGMAHEVNNPLGSIMLYAHLVKKRLQENDPSQDDIKFIMDEAKRCQTIVSGLLNFSRQGQLSLVRQHISSVIDKTIKAIRQQPLFRAIDIRSFVDDDVPEMVLDADQLYQVFLNLAVNAAEAMPDGGTLTIRAKIEMDRLTIYFEDTGIGIAKENVAKLFTPFYTTKQIGKGTGLGLAIAYGIIKMHKGSIRVLDSQLGKGTIFIIDLPILMDESAVDSNGGLSV